MNTARLSFFLALAVFLFPAGARAQEKPEKSVTDLRQELAELKQVVSALSARL